MRSLTSSEWHILLDAAQQSELISHSSNTLERRSQILKGALISLGEEITTEIAILVARFIGCFPSRVQPKLNYLYKWQVTYDPVNRGVVKKLLDYYFPVEFFDEIVALQREVNDLEQQERERLLHREDGYLKLEHLSKQLMALPVIQAGKYPIEDHEIIEGEESGVQLSWKITRQTYLGFETFDLSLGGDPELFVFFMCDMVQLLGSPVAERWDPNTRIFFAKWPTRRLARNH